MVVGNYMWIWLSEQLTLQRRLWIWPGRLKRWKMVFLTFRRTKTDRGTGLTRNIPERTGIRMATIRMRRSMIVLTLLNFILAAGMRHNKTELVTATPQLGKKTNRKISIICSMLTMLFEFVLKEVDR